MKKLALSLTLALSMLFCQRATAQELIKDINPGGQSSFPSGYININGTVFFEAIVAGFGYELWKSDGTEAGTVMVKDIRPGSIGASARELTNVNGTLFFRADDGVAGYELWKSDGTAEGTVMVKDIRPGSVGGTPYDLTVSNGILFFRATDGIATGNVGEELWRSDGTASGTMPVQDIRPGFYDSSPEFLHDLNGTLLFIVTLPSTNGKELWKSDGSAEGTALVKAFPSIGAVGAFANTLPNFWVIGDEMFFIPYDYSSSTSGSELWKSDGTSEGTVLVTKIRIGEGGMPRSFAANAGELFFKGLDDVHGWELWKSDGTAAGTAMVKDIYAGAAGSTANYLHSFNGSVYFAARTAESGLELWKSDGTEGGTNLLKDIFSGTGDSQTSGFLTFNGRLLFGAVDESGVGSAWRTDGTEAGTIKMPAGVGVGGKNSDGNLLSLAVSNTLFYTRSGELWKYVEESNLPAPVITNFTPASGSVGTTVIIYGANFSTTPGENVVKFNNTTATVIASMETSLAVTVPQGATSGTIIVTVEGQTATSVDSFTVSTAPTITGFSPSGGQNGTAVIITGSNFSTEPVNNVVKFNDIPATVTESTSTTITTSVPEQATTGLITVTIGSETATSATSFTIEVPTISGFNPASGQVGTEVTIFGSGFSIIPANNTVKFNDVPATVTASTETAITAIVPGGATTGLISVIIGSQTATSTTSYVVPAPTIMNFFPPEGQAGSLVEILGSNFSPVPASNVVLFNGAPAIVLASTENTILTTVPAEATNGPISVVIGSQVATSTDSFEVLAPAIENFSPTEGPVGTEITIFGSNFSLIQAGNVVMFNGAAATVTTSTANTITTTVPEGATTGPISVVIGSQIVTSIEIFTVAAPTIIGFTPTTGQVGTSVTIIGTGFSTIAENQQVYFNGTKATITSSAHTNITTTVPDGATTGAINVTMGIEILTSADVFTVPSPMVTGFTPSTGEPGTLVTITGENFSIVPSSNIVMFNGIAAVVTASTETTITTSVPADATSGTISVSIGSHTGMSSAIFTVTEPTIPLPVITGFTPIIGEVGTVVIITGENFNIVPGVNIVKFNGTAAIVTASTATSITTAVPEDATSGTISITIGNQTATSLTGFTVTEPIPAPAIIDFTPGSGEVGTVITITGENFNIVPGVNIVKFNGTTAVVTASTATTITTAVPANATTGTISVSIGALTATSSANFTVTEPTPPAPVITSFDPVLGEVGTLVTITGENFSFVQGGNIVKFNGKTAVVEASNATSIIVTVPENATSGPISVSVEGQTATTSTGFTVTQPTSTELTITSLSPVSGQIGTEVTINGTNFSSNAVDNIVKFNNVAATVLSSATMSLTVIVPEATTGLVTVTVGDQTATNATEFVIPAPAITSFTPNSDQVGTVVTITGTDFSPVPEYNVVKFNNVQATVTASTSTTITTTVPVGAITGAITVAIGSQSATSANNFVVIIPVPAPVITGFTPGTGTVGTAVTISGDNFSTTASNNSVKFNGKVAAITGTPTATSINVTVPQNAGTGKITVTVGGQTATSATDFVVVACTKPPKPTITGTNLNTEMPVLTSSSATGNQWLINGTAVPNFTGASLNVTQAGVFNVRVLVPGGCVSDLSDDFVIVVTDAGPQGQGVIKYYPNPVADKLIVEVHQPGSKTMQVFNTNGTLMERLQFESGEVEVDVRSYSVGVYYFVVSTGSGVVSGKFVKK